MSITKAVKDLQELQLLRHALARVGDYRPGNVTVAVRFNNEDAFRSSGVRDLINETAAQCIKAALPTAQMRAAMTERIQTRITALEAKYPAAITNDAG